MTHLPTDARDRGILALGQRMATREAAWLSALKLPGERQLLKGDLPKGFDDNLQGALLRLLEKQFRDAAAQAVGELMAFRRAYAVPMRAMPGEGWRMVADYYGFYLPRLTGIVREDLLRNVRATLQQGEAEGLDGNTLTERLGRVLAGFRRSRLSTIVRTEGTRAQSLARRHIGLLASESGYGPDYYIGSAILDDRTTRTCTFWHGKRWTPEQDQNGYNILWTPNHYNCRSMIRFGYEGMDDDLPAWNESLLARFEAIQREEFPKWDNKLIYVPDERLLVA